MMNIASFWIIIIVIITQLFVALDIKCCRKGPTGPDWLAVTQCSGRCIPGYITGWMGLSSQWLSLCRNFMATFQHSALPFWACVLLRFIGDIKYLIYHYFYRFSILFYSIIFHSIRFDLFRSDPFRSVSCNKHTNESQRARPNNHLISKQRARSK